MAGRLVGGIPEGLIADPGFRGFGGILGGALEGYQAWKEDQRRRREEALERILRRRELGIERPEIWEGEEIPTPWERERRDIERREDFIIGEAEMTPEERRALRAAMMGKRYEEPEEPEGLEDMNVEDLMGLRGALLGVDPNNPEAIPVTRELSRRGILPPEELEVKTPPRVRAPLHGFEAPWAIKGEEIPGVAPEIPLPPVPRPKRPRYKVREIR